MNAIVPDTLQGALIVSAIDFFLSFVIISGIGFVLAAFPLLNRVAQFVKPAPAKGAKHAGKPAAPARAASPTAMPAPAEDIAAIAAAVFAVMEGTPHRIINIEPVPGRSAWVAEGRFAQHRSHRPK